MIRDRVKKFMFADVRTYGYVQIIVWLKTWSKSGSFEGRDSSLMSRQFSLKDNSENAARVNV